MWQDARHFTTLPHSAASPQTGPQQYVRASTEYRPLYRTDPLPRRNRSQSMPTTSTDPVVVSDGCRGCSEDEGQQPVLDSLGVAQPQVSVALPALALHLEHAHDQEQSLEQNGSVREGVVQTCTNRAMLWRVGECLSAASAVLSTLEASINAKQQITTCQVGI